MLILFSISILLFSLYAAWKTLTYSVFSVRTITDLEQIAIVIENHENCTYEDHCEIFKLRSTHLKQFLGWLDENRQFFGTVFAVLLINITIFACSLFDSRIFFFEILSSVGNAGLVVALLTQERRKMSIQNVYVKYGFIFASLNQEDEILKLYHNLLKQRTENKE